MKNLNQHTDTELIRQYLSGNTEAFASIVLRHKQRIYSTISLLVRDRCIADDIFQDVFIRIIEKLKAGYYTEEGKFISWAIRIAHNMCLDHFRRSKRNPVINKGDGQFMPEDAYCAISAADRLIVKGGGPYKNVRTLLDMLPQEQREVIILRHYANLSFKEIARLNQCGINTALGRMRYGLMNLRRLMEEKNAALT